MPVLRKPAIRGLRAERQTEAEAGAQAEGQAMRRGNDWERRFGRRRRAIDRALLEELERRIAAEDHKMFVETDKRFSDEWAGKAEREARERREAIARAFGRPSAEGAS